MGIFRQSVTPSRQKNFKVRYILSSSIKNSMKLTIYRNMRYVWQRCPNDVYGGDYN